MTNRLFRGFVIRFFLNPVLLFIGETLKIPGDAFLYYLTDISMFAVGGAAFSSIHVTKTWQLFIGIVIILAWISVAYVTAVGLLIFLPLACFG